jgi:hypothetical protein
VTISDDAETHPSTNTIYTTHNLHPTLAHDMEEFEIRSSATSVYSKTFHDLNDSSNSTTEHYSSPPPPPQVVRQTPPEAPKLFLQPIHQSRIDPQMHFFHQPYQFEPVIEQRRMGYGSGFGGGYGGVFGAIPTIILDPEWHSFAEHLGF